ncbi:MAG TPA: hypothetical protein VNL70_10495 [Tepidisphaeraceae bacterium]|nr:hypothetical protein [Tepidisphaeraceae bacterium]
MGKIFERQRLTASQLRTVAERRFDDAEYLRNSRLNARANGIFYLGGFVIECLLKARLVEEYPSVVLVRDPALLSRQDRAIWDLVFRSHDLDSMLSHLPSLTRKMAVAHSGGFDALAKLRKICSQWTVFARYSTHSETMEHASRFLQTIRELKRWLKQ